MKKLKIENFRKIVLGIFGLIPNEEIDLLYGFFETVGHISDSDEKYIRTMLIKYGKDRLIARAIEIKEKNVISYNSFAMLFKQYITSLSKDDSYLFYSYFSKLNYTYEDVQSILFGAKRLSLLTNKKANTGKNVLQIIRTLNTETDRKLLRKLSDIDLKFKSYFMSTKTDYRKLDQLISNCYARVAKRSITENHEIEDFSEKNLSYIEKLAKLYTVLVSHLKATNTPESEAEGFVRVADYLLAKRINGLTATLDLMNEKKIEEFSGFLTMAMDESNADKKEVFTAGDIVSLLSSAASSIAFASAEKLEAVRNSFSLYFSELARQAGDEKTFSKFSAKEVILNSGTLLQVSPENISYSTNIMLGKSINEIIDSSVLSEKNNNQNTEIKQILYTIYPNLKIEGTENLEKQLYFINHPSIFVKLHPSNIYETTVVLQRAFYRGFELDKKPNTLYDVAYQKTALAGVGFNVENLYTVDNIANIFQGSFGAYLNNQENEDNMVKNIQFLSTIISPSDILKIFKHNAGLFMLDNNKLTHSFMYVIGRSTDSTEISLGLERLFNEHVPTTVLLKDKKPGKENVKTSNPSIAKERNKNDDFDYDYINIESLKLNVDGLVALGASLTNEDKNDLKNLGVKSTPKRQPKIITAKNECNYILDQLLRIQTQPFGNGIKVSKTIDELETLKLKLYTTKFMKRLDFVVSKLDELDARQLTDLQELLFQSTIYLPELRKFLSEKNNEDHEELLRFAKTKKSEATAYIIRKMIDVEKQNLTFMKRVFKDESILISNSQAVIKGLKKKAPQIEIEEKLYAEERVKSRELLTECGKLSSLISMLADLETKLTEVFETVSDYFMINENTTEAETVVADEDSKEEEILNLEAQLESLQSKLKTTEEQIRKSAIRVKSINKLNPKLLDDENKKELKRHSKLLQTKADYEKQIADIKALLDSIKPQ